MGRLDGVFSCAARAAAHLRAVSASVAGHPSRHARELRDGHHHPLLAVIVIVIVIGRHRQDNHGQSLSNSQSSGSPKLAIGDHGSDRVDD